MNRFAWAVVALSCAAPLGAEDVRVFTPSRTGDAPVYMNGEVVRIDRSAGTVTLRGSDGTRSVFTLDRATLDSSASLRPGARVIVGYRTMGSGAAERRVVSDLRAGSVVEGRVSTRAAVTTSGSQSMGVARVVSVDPAGRRLTVVDSNGATRVLDVRGSAVGRLGALNPGDSISLGVAAPLVSGTPAGTVTSIGSTGNVNAPRETTNAAGRGTGTMDMNTGATTGAAPRTDNRNGAMSFEPRPGDPTPPVGGPTGRTDSGSTGGNTPSTTAGTTPTFTNSSLPAAPGLPAAPPNGVSTNPGQTGVQPAPAAQPIPGVQGPTGVQPVPGAQPLPGTGVTGQGATNPGMNPQSVPGAGGQTSNNAGATGGTSAGVATRGGGSPVGAMSANGVGNPAVTTRSTGGTTTTNGTQTVGGTTTSGVPQLGTSTSAINSQIPSIPPPARGGSNAVLPLPSVTPETNPPTTPAEVAAVRELGSRDFDAAIATLGARAAEVDRAWAAYRSACVTSTIPLNNRSREWFGLIDGSITRPTDDACEQGFAEVERLAQSVNAGIGTAREAARRADVLPGRMREVQQRYNLDL